MLKLLQEERRGSHAETDLRDNLAGQGVMTRSIRSSFPNLMRATAVLLILGCWGYHRVLAQRYFTTFGVVTQLKTLRDARGLLSGDFNADGIADLAVYGGKKVQFHLRRTGKEEWHTFALRLERPVHQAVADRCNNDLLTDIIVLTDSEPEIDVYIAKSNEKFYRSWKRTLQSGFDKLVVGDVNNDGRADIVLFGKKELGLTVLLGRGNGTFTSGPILFSDLSFSNVLIDDANGDGTSDIFCTNWITNELLFFTGVGKMKFGEPSVLPMQSEPSSLKTAYLNNDLNKDLIVGFSDMPAVQTYLGDGLGGFHLGHTLSIQSSADEIFAGDVNGDGRNDVVVFSAAKHTLTVGLNSGDGMLSDHVDFDAGISPAQAVLLRHPLTHLIDAAVLDTGTSRIRVFNNSQTLSRLTSDSYYGTGHSPRGVVMGNFNRTGSMDVAVANTESQTISLFMSQRARELAGQIPVQTPMPVEYFQTYTTHDSVIQFIGTSRQVERIAVMNVNLSNYSSFSTIIPTTGHPVTMAAKVDPVQGFLHIYSFEREAAGHRTMLTEYEQVSPSRFIERTISTLSRHPLLAATMGDFDGDGNIDVAFATYNERRKKEEIYVARGTRSEEFEREKFSFDFDEPSPVVLLMWNVDLNRDGIMDLIIDIPSDEQRMLVSVGRRDSVFSFSPQLVRIKEPVALSVSQDLQVTDLNGDGKPDIVLNNGYNKTIQAYLGKGDGTFMTSMRLISSEGFGGFAVTEFDEDSSPELVLTDARNGLIRIIALEGGE